MSKLAEEILQFIVEPEIKTKLESDLDELNKAMEAKLWKASIVLIGSLTEAVLYYHISSTDSIRNQISNFEKRNDLTLQNLLVQAKKHEIIDDNLYRLSEPIRDYRNLIHPSVQERLKIHMTDNLVQIGYHVLLEIVRSVNKNYAFQASQEAKFMVEKVINSVCDRSATNADLKVYTPILEKYGNTIGAKIIERSLQKGRRSE